MNAPLIRLRNLVVVARDDDGQEFPIVRNVSFDVAPGEVLALIGESGSGKTTIALTMLGYARSGCRIAEGSVELEGERLEDASPARLRSLRGQAVAYVAQSAAAAFNPSLTIMQQIIEPALIHRLMDRTTAEAKARDIFKRLALPDPENVGDRYPHQVSGGQLQRLMAAMALITDPKLVIFDEPTTALDVTTQIEVLRVFKAVVRDLGTTAVYVSHDLAVVAQIADRIVVLRQGEIQEIASTEALLDAPTHDYSRALLKAAAPRLLPEPLPPSSITPAPLLELESVSAGYGDKTIVERISLSIPPGKVLGVIGESGSGKSTIARVVAGLHPASEGILRLSGQPLAGSIAQRSREDLRRIQLVFQSADTALNPAVPVRAALDRPLTLFRGFHGAELDAEVRRLLDLVHLPATLADRLPGELSGGQKQRINLARALAAKPDLILCDEVTSALDPVVAEAVLDLLVELRHELHVSYMFITHDLNVVRAIADDVLVLQRGAIVEHASATALFVKPAHPYTELLMRSVPALRRGWLEEATDVSVRRA